MARIRYTGKCHTKGCKNFIDESMARFVAIYWYYCPDCVQKQKELKCEAQNKTNIISNDVVNVAG